MTTKLLLKPCVAKKVIENKNYDQHVACEERFYWLQEEYNTSNIGDLILIKKSDDYDTEKDGWNKKNCHLTNGRRGLWQAKSAFFNVTELSDEQLKEMVDICKQKYVEMGL